MRTRKVPKDARHLRCYAELESYLQDFVNGVYPFLWIVGRPGAAKTESVRAALRKKPAYYREGGQLTALQFYMDLYQHRGLSVVLDDADHILESSLGAKLIGALGNTKAVKHLSYSSTTKALGETPQTFATTSSLCIVANKG